MRTSWSHRTACAVLALAVSATVAAAGGLGTRVYVVERETGSLALYDYSERRLLPQRVEGLGNLRHATMTFTPDLRHAHLATRSGQLSRIDLSTGKLVGTTFTSENSIDNAVSQDGRWIAVAEYIPGGLTILDSTTLEPVAKIPGEYRDGDEVKRSRVTGVVDAPGNRFVCVLIEGSEIWVVDASRPDFPVERRVKTPRAMPYDAMITPDGRYYVVVHLGSAHASVLDLRHPEKGVIDVSLDEPGRVAEKGTPVKLPHVASWAVAGRWCFVPLVGESRLAVLDRTTWTYQRSIPLRGHPVYAVAAPGGAEIWVSFSGEKDDAFVQVVDTQALAVTDTVRVGRRIYHIDFTPRGSHVLVSANGDDKLVLVDARTHAIVDEQALRSPSGIFGPWRAFRLGL